MCLGETDSFTPFASGFNSRTSFAVDAFLDAFTLVFKPTASEFTRDTKWLSVDGIQDTLEQSDVNLIIQTTSGRAVNTFEDPE